MRCAGARNAPPTQPPVRTRRLTASASPAVFISYRRADSSYVARDVHDAYVAQVGAPAVFLDVYAIPPGEDFRTYIARKLETCELVLVLIGRRWLDTRDRSGALRLFDPGDFVRLEIEHALRGRKLVVPVLIEGATMPAVSDLPRSLHPLVTRNACVLEPGQASLRKLVQRVEERRRSAPSLVDAGNGRRSRWAEFFHSQREPLAQGKWEVVARELSKNSSRVAAPTLKAFIRAGFQGAFFELTPWRLALVTRRTRSLPRHPVVTVLLGGSKRIAQPPAHGPGEPSIELRAWAMCATILDALDRGDTHANCGRGSNVVRWWLLGGDPPPLSKPNLRNRLRVANGVHDVLSRAQLLSEGELAARAAQLTHMEHELRRTGDMDATEERFRHVWQRESGWLALAGELFVWGSAHPDADSRECRTFFRRLQGVKLDQDAPAASWSVLAIAHAMVGAAPPARELYVERETAALRLIELAAQVVDTVPQQLLHNRHCLSMVWDAVAAFVRELLAEDNVTTLEAFLNVWRGSGAWVSSANVPLRRIVELVTDALPDIADELLFRFLMALACTTSVRRQLQPDKVWRGTVRKFLNQSTWPGGDAVRYWWDPEAPESDGPRWRRAEAVVELLDTLEPGTTQSWRVHARHWARVSHGHNRLVQLARAVATPGIPSG